MPLISEGYRELNRQLHATNDGYGRSGHRWADLVRDVVSQTQATSVLDYGCGKRTLEEALGYAIRNYDPAVEGLDTPPEPADVVVCTDVLEHVEPDSLDDVVAHLRSLTQKVCVLVVATRPAKKTLADGRNAHLIQWPIGAWLGKLCMAFEPLNVQNFGGEFLFIGRPA